MNLNQQSSGDNWKTHRALMQTCSPIVDCGVHYVDIMCLMTGSRPVRVSGNRRPPVRRIAARHGHTTVNCR